MKTITRITLLATIFFLTSCAEVFYSPDAKKLAVSQKNIAILPPDVSLKPRNEIDAETLKEQQRTESLNIQREIYGWMLKRKSQGKIDKEIQQIETTNAKLQKAGYPETPLTTSEMCQLLEVDGIMTSNFRLSKPLSEGAAVALGLVIGVWGPTNEVNVSMSINDCQNDKLIWNYKHNMSGSVGSDTPEVVDRLMRNASRKMPYFK